MTDLNLTHRFRKQLENAILFWEKGEEQIMIDLLHRVQAESFEEGRACMREQIERFLDTEIHMINT